MKHYRRLLAYVWPYRFRLAGSMLCGLLVSGFTTVSVLLVKPILDEIFIQRDTAKLAFFPALILGLYIVRGLCDYGNSYLIRSLGQRVIRDIRNQCFSHMLTMPLTYFHRHHTGVLMSRISNDVTLMERAVSGALSSLLRQGLTFLGLFGAAFYNDWFLALLAVLVLPPASVFIVQLGRKLRRLSRQAQERIGMLNALMEEVFSGIRIIKGFTREAYESKRFRSRNDEYYRVTMRAVRADELVSPVMEFLAALGVVAVIWYGGRQVIHGVTTPGTFFSFLTAIFMLYEPMRKLSHLNNTVQASMAATGRVFEVLDTATEHAQDAGKPLLAPIQHGLAFQHVCMRYQPASRLVLHDITLEARVGEVVALVGMSGAGKTSLVHLIPRFYDTEHGCITIDGVDINQVTLASLRAQIGIVSQDVVLFDDTLRQNILYGNLHATPEQVTAAAQAAYAHDFIMQMPQGYDTLIGERGVRLSGGEKQRIAIARAILRNAPILILDEATSALDSESEQMVQYALDNLMKDRTTFVIAHRLSTVRHADKIVVLHDGRLVEMGRHAELLAKGGSYSRLYDIQFKGQEQRRPPLEPL